MQSSYFIMLMTRSATVKSVFTGLKENLVDAHQQGYLASNGIVYQLIPGGLAGATNEQQYTWVDLTATRGSDEKALWSTHFQLQAI